MPASSATSGVGVLINASNDPVEISPPSAPGSAFTAVWTNVYAMMPTIRNPKYSGASALIVPAIIGCSAPLTK